MKYKTYKKTSIKPQEKISVLVLVLLGGGEVVTMGMNPNQCELAIRIGSKTRLLWKLLFFVLIAITAATTDLAGHEKPLLPQIGQTNAKKCKSENNRNLINTHSIW